MKRLMDWREFSILYKNLGAKIMRLRGICKKMGEKVGGSAKNDYLCGGFFKYGNLKKVSY